jgi:hypothetical protein
MKSATAFLFILLLTFAVQAQDQDWHQFMSQSAYDQFAVAQQQEQPTPAVVTVTKSGAKSPRKAGLYSALLPGAGQYYNKSYWQAGICLVVEALGWTAWATYDKKGDDIKAEFRKFADIHWSESEYWSWVSQHSGISYTPDSMNVLRAWEQEHFSHGLHKQKDQQYYEMIGKYDQFNAGWDDSGHKGLSDQGWDKSMRTTRRLHYEQRRYDSNRAYKNANWGITMVLINHILSAAEAAYLCKLHNDKLSMNLNIVPYIHENRLYSCLSLHIKW